MDFLHLLILFELSIFFSILQFLDFLNRFWTFWQKWTKNWSDSIFWSFGCESFCPYRAYCWLPLYPGRCHWIGAAALYLCSTLRPAIFNSLWPVTVVQGVWVKSPTPPGSFYLFTLLPFYLFTFLPFYLFTFYILNVKNITYFKYHIDNRYFSRFIFVSLQQIWYK